MNTRAKLTGAAVGAIAVTASVVALTGAATAEDSEPTDETIVAEQVDAGDIDPDAIIVELDEGNEVYLGETEGETFEAEYVEEGDLDLDENVVTIDISEADEGDWVEYEVD